MFGKRRNEIDKYCLIFTHLNVIPKNMEVYNFNSMEKEFTLSCVAFVI